MRHTPFAELLRYFFASLFRVEGAADDDSYKVWMFQILALLLTAAWQIPVQLFRRYADLQHYADPERYRLAYSTDTFFAICILSLVIALLALVEWSELLPSRQDHLVLAPLPIPRLSFFAAKLGALTIFFSVAIIGTSLLIGVALPGIASGALEPRPALFRMALLTAQLLGAGYFTFWSMVAVQGLLMSALPVRWFECVSFAVQITLVVAVVCALPLLPYLPAAKLIANEPRWLAYVPPAWFWRFDQNAAWALAIAASAAAGSYLISYLQYSRYQLESPRRVRKIFDAIELVARLFRKPESRAICEFTLRTLSRCRKQKLVFLVIAGMGVAVIAEGAMYLIVHPTRNPVRAAQELQAAIISAPLTLSFFSMVGLRRAFRIPEELRANWLFQVVETGSAEEQIATAVTCFLLVGAAPFWLASIPVEAAVFGIRAVVVLAAQAVLMYALAGYLMSDWRALPFTFAQNAARRHFIQSMVVHLIELIVYSFIASEWIRAAMHSWRSLAALAIVLAGTTFLIRRLRTDEPDAPLEFAERLSQAVEELRLVQH